MQRHFLKRVNTQELQSSVQVSGQVELLVEDGDDQIYGYRDPDLSFHRVGAGSQKVFDAHVTLDPTEEEFDLPSRTIESGDGDRWDIEVVGQEDQIPARVGIKVAHFAQRPGKVGKARRDGWACQSDRCGLRWDSPQAGSDGGRIEDSPWRG